MGMLSTKDHREIFQTLLRPGDTLSLVPVSGHATAPPQELADLAQQVCPELVHIRVYNTLSDGLASALSGEGLPILCGSLYLLGRFLELQEAE